MAQSVVIENNRPTYAYRAADITPAQASPAGEPTHWMADWTGVSAESPILRNANESISISFGGVQTIPGGTSLYLYIEWTEEAGA